MMETNTTQFTSELFRKRCWLFHRFSLHRFSILWPMAWFLANWNNNRGTPSIVAYALGFYWFARPLVHCTRTNWCWCSIHCMCRVGYPWIWWTMWLLWWRWQIPARIATVAVHNFQYYSTLNIGPMDFSLALNYVVFDGSTNWRLRLNFDWLLGPVMSTWFVNRMIQENVCVPFQPLHWCGPSYWLSLNNHNRSHSHRSLSLPDYPKTLASAAYTDRVKQTD